MWLTWIVNIVTTLTMQVCEYCYCIFMGIVNFVIIYVLTRIVNILGHTKLLPTKTASVDKDTSNLIYMI